MSFSVMVFLDRFVGPILCWLLTAFSRVRQMVIRPVDDAGSPRRICVIKLIEQGSTVLALDAFRRASKMVGGDNVFAMVFAPNRFIIDATGAVPSEQVLAVRIDNPLHLATDLAATLRRLRELEVDTVIDFEFFARGSAILAFLSGARRRIGFHRFTAEGPYRGDLFTHPVQYNPHIHTSQTFSLLVDAASGACGSLPLPKRPIPPISVTARQHEAKPEAVKRVQKLLEDETINADEDLLVLLNPNASDLLPLRRWPDERYVALGQRLLADHPTVRLAITGSAAETDTAQAIAVAIGEPTRVANFAGRTSLDDLLALYHVATVLVTNDSGPAHFASVTPLRTVVLFGPETPHLYRPLTTRATSLTADLACSPCVNVFNHRISPCRDNQCMQQITVEQVCEAVESALNPE